MKTVLLLSLCAVLAGCSEAPKRASETPATLNPEGELRVGGGYATTGGGYGPTGKWLQEPQPERIVVDKSYTPGCCGEAQGPFVCPVCGKGFRFAAGNDYRYNAQGYLQCAACSIATDPAHAD
jgi:hypothetical protein